MITVRNEDEKHNYHALVLELHYNYNNSHYNNTITTITVGVATESAVTPTVIVALFAHHSLSPALIDSA